jgi:hypothetical protein
MDAKNYRQAAQRYLARARELRDPGHRAALIDMAAYCMRLAERAEPVVQQQQQAQSWAKARPTASNINEN